MCQASKVFFNAKREIVDDTRISIQIYAIAEWPRTSRNVWSISTCFDIPDKLSPSNFPRKKVFYSTLQYMSPISFSLAVRFLPPVLTISQQAKISLDWIKVTSLNRKRTYYCFKQLTANNGKNAFEKNSKIYIKTHENLAQIRFCYKLWRLKRKPYSVLNSLHCFPSPKKNKWSCFNRPRHPRNKIAAKHYQKKNTERRNAMQCCLIHCLLNGLLY